MSPDSSNFNKFVLFAFYWILTLLAGGINGFQYYQYSLQIPEWPQTGHLGDILPSAQYSQWHLIYMLSLNFLGIFFYLSIWALMQFKTGNQREIKWECLEILSASPIHSMLLRSMAVIVAINIGGYLANAGIRMFLLPLIGLNQLQTWIAYTYLGILLNICVTLNAVVLYICSSEYRACFKAEFYRIFYKDRVQDITKMVS